METVREAAAQELRQAMEAIPGLPQKIEKDDQSLIAQANRIYVTDDYSRALAGHLFNVIYKRKKEYQERLEGFDKRKKTVKASLDAIYNGFKNLLVSPFQEAQDRLSVEIGKWDKVLEDARLAEQTRLQEIADKKARDQQLEAAVQLAKHGDDEEAAELLSQQPVAAKVDLGRFKPKVEGQSIRTYYHAEVVDLSFLVKEWLAGNVEKNMVIANQAYLDDYVQLNKGQCDIPGVKVRSETKTRPSGKQ